MPPKPKSWTQVRKAAATQRRLTPKAAAGSAVALLSNPNLTVMDLNGKILRNDDQKSPAGLRSRTANEKRTSRFLCLPPNIRAQIFRHIFQGTEIEIPRRGRENLQGRYLPPGILMVSRQIIKEANPIFYAEARFTFSLEAAYRLEEWLKKIGSTRRQWLTDARFETLQPIGEPGDGAATQLLQHGRSANAVLGYHRRLHGLKEGVLRVDLRIEGEGTIWTAEPLKVVGEVLEGARWEVGRGWVWIREVRGELKELIREKQTEKAVDCHDGVDGDERKQKAGVGEDIEIVDLSMCP